MRESEKRAIERCSLIYEKSMKASELGMALKATQLQYEIEIEIDKREEAEERLQKQKKFRDEISKQDREAMFA